MDSSLIVVVCCTLAGLITAQNEPQFEKAPERYVVENQNQKLNMKCAVNKGAGFLASKVMRIVHRNAKTGTEQRISNQGNLVEGFKEKGYTIKFSYEPVCSVEIDIDQVTADMDGTYVCQVMKSDEILEFVESQVTVLGGIERIEMKINSQDVGSTNMMDFKPGNLNVECLSYGSNPAPDIHLKFGGENIAADVTSLEDPDSNLERVSFKGSVAYVLDFKPEMFNKDLVCHAETLLPDGVTLPDEVTLPDKSISVTLKGIVDEPSVSCTNNTATIKDRRVTLECLLSKVPQVKSVYFNVGNNYNIYPGNKTADLIECTEKSINSTHYAVILQFYEMEEWHFTANIYLDVQGYDDSRLQIPVFMIKDVTAGASPVFAALSVMVLLMLSTLLPTLLHS